MQASDISLVRSMAVPRCRTVSRPGTLVVVAMFTALLGSSPAQAQPRGPRGDAERQHDMATFHFLLDHRDEIVRQVTTRPDGVQTLTESDNPEVAAKIVEHAEAMHRRLKENRPIHMRDPLFREVFRNADKIKMSIEKTDKGVKISESSQDPYVVRLIQAHAEVLTQFLAKGFEEVRKNHPVPPRDGARSAEFQYPLIKNYGGIVVLADAAQQPKQNSKVLLDIISDEESGNVIKGLDRAALMLNLYSHAGAGTDNGFQMAIILHGPATKAVLTDSAYAKHTNLQADSRGGAGNPNSELMGQLRRAGVEIYVCGQALAHHGYPLDEVAPEVTVAVSAATVNINLQMDGYAYIPFD